MKSISTCSIWAPLLTVSTLATALHIPRQGGITWGPCQTIGNTTTNLTCATLPVPRDYLSPEDDATINLKLARAKAPKSPCKGTVLFNPGGPGFAGRNSLNDIGDTLTRVLGHYDVVAWDYRGTGDTLPFSCFPTEAERAAYYASVVAVATNASDTSIGQAWATAQWMTALCKNSTDAQKAGKLIGTAYTARDMMQIVDALGEDGLLRYWGISYGSALGEAAAAMFPDRMHRVVMDAVANPTEWWEGWSLSQITDADSVLESFCAECMKAPDLCPLAARASLPEELASEIYNMIDDVRDVPIVLGENGLLTYASIKTKILSALYSASEFPQLALYLDALVTRNETAIIQYLTTIGSATASTDPFPDYSPATTKENVWGIRCSDEFYRTNRLTDVPPVVEDFHSESRIIGDITCSTAALACAQWPFEAKERPPLPFEKIRTAHPMLFISNMYDPVTSMAGGRNASASFPGSRQLINEGHGHSSRSQMSACTVRALRAYFDNGTLPEEGKICSPTIPAFTTKTIDDVLAEIDEEE